MKRLFIIFIGLIFTVFSCNKKDTENTLSTEEMELLKSIEKESALMLASSLNDFNVVLSNSSVEELKKFDAKKFAKNSILNHIKKSPFRNPHYDLIKKALNGNAQSSGFTNSEKPYVANLKKAFALLPDRSSFSAEIKRINAKIVSEILDKRNRIKLLTLNTASLAAVNHLLDNEDDIIAQYYRMRSV